MFLSVVVPMFNEEASVDRLVDRLRPVLDGLGQPYEVVCVDDGSTDATYERLAEIHSRWPNTRVVRLRRNAGHQGAQTAGLDNARGDWVITMDADLQDPPELIPSMITAAEEGQVDVVYAVRSDRRSDSAFKRVSADLFYRIMNRSVGAPVIRHAADFRLMSAAAVREIRALPEQGRVYRLLIPHMGFRSATVEYTRDPRAAGESKYPLRKMVQLAADSYFSFTAAPLRVATWLGVAGFVACSGFAVIALVAYTQGRTLPGWTSFALAVGFIGATQFVFLGLIGEYLARVYTELKRRPMYFSDSGGPRRVEHTPSDTCGEIPRVLRGDHAPHGSDTQVARDTGLEGERRSLG